MTTIYTTCPPSTAYAAADYLASVRRIARWSEDCGAEGMLIYTDNSLVDPWCVAQHVLTSTRRLLPLVATQPVYAPPFTIAKRISSLASIYGRAVALNMVAGGFVKDLSALNDNLAHDDRYDRLYEYTKVIKQLLGNEQVALEGRFYSLSGARLHPPMPARLMPKVFVSGSSKAGAEAAARLDAIAVSYPTPPGEVMGPVAPGSFARVGVIARSTTQEAWTVAHSRFPLDGRGEMMHRMATAVSDSVWHRTLAELAAGAGGELSPYWLHPLKTYRTFCPYLVGSHADVAVLLASYHQAGFAGFILDVPHCEEDLLHTNRAFQQAALRPADLERDIRGRASYKRSS